MKPNKDSIIIFSCDDLMSTVTPQINPHLVSFRQLRCAADTGHLATFIGKTSVIHWSQTLSILKYGTLSPSTHRHVHSEVIKSLQRAGEDARVRAVCISLVGQHIHKLQDARVVGGAVSDVQLGCEGNYSSCSGDSNAD